MDQIARFVRLQRYASTRRRQLAVDPDVDGISRRHAGRVLVLDGIFHLLAGLVDRLRVPFEHEGIRGLVVDSERVDTELGDGRVEERVIADRHQSAGTDRIGDRFERGIDLVVPLGVSVSGVDRRLQIRRAVERRARRDDDTVPDGHAAWYVRASVQIVVAVRAVGLVAGLCEGGPNRVGRERPLSHSGEGRTREAVVVLVPDPEVLQVPTLGGPAGDQVFGDGAVERSGLDVGEEPDFVRVAVPLCGEPAAVLRRAGVGNIDAAVLGLVAEWRETGTATQSSGQTDRDGRRAAVEHRATRRLGGVVWWNHRGT